MDQHQTAYSADLVNRADQLSAKETNISFRRWRGRRLHTSHYITRSHYCWAQCKQAQQSRCQSAMQRKLSQMWVRHFSTICSWLYTSSICPAQLHSSSLAESSTFLFNAGWLLPIFLPSYCPFFPYPFLLAFKAVVFNLPYIMFFFSFLI